MARSVEQRRLLGLILLLCLGFAGLGCRLTYLQVFRHDELRGVAERQAQRTFVSSPLRGEILDRDGNVLATTRDVKRICADPVLIGDYQEEVARVLAPLLAPDERQLMEQLAIRPIYRNGEVVTQNNGEIVLDRYVVLEEEVPREVAEKVRERMRSLSIESSESDLSREERRFLFRLRHQAVFAEDQKARRYPHGPLASHLLGFVRDEVRRTPYGAVQQLVGVNGIEASFNSFLSGISGWRQTAIYPREGEQLVFRRQDVEPKQGMNVRLTLDLVLQELVEEELQRAVEEFDPDSASVMMIEPDTGRILAAAVVPGFDPNRPNESSDEERRNRLVTDVMEPGSTFKIVTVAAALNEGIVSLEEQFDCENGRFYYAGRSLRDHHAYDRLSVREIVTKSSNIGAAKIGLRLGPRRLYEYMRRFGFGRLTGIPLAGEVRGVVHPVDQWSKLSITRIPMGHEVAVTPIQLVMAMGAIANGGELMRPMLVEGIEDGDGELIARYRPQSRGRVVGSEAAARLTQALTGVVSREGTGRRAMLDRYRVAGKTGTAKKPGYDENGVFRYLPGKYISSFVGFLPAEDPELCISVVMDEPYPLYYGGQTAAPVFRRIAERAARQLNLPPDIRDRGPVQDTHVSPQGGGMNVTASTGNE